MIEDVLEVESKSHSLINLTHLGKPTEDAHKPRPLLVCFESLAEKIKCSGKYWNRKV